MTLNTNQDHKQLGQFNKRKTGGNRGSVAAEFFGQGSNLGGDSLDQNDMGKSSQEYFGGQNFEMKVGLDGDNEKGISPEEMFGSPMKMGKDISMVGEDQIEICLKCKKTRPDN